MVKTDNFILRYANCWEDADLLTSWLASCQGGSILSVCSGGENSLSLLTCDPAEVLVVDVNPKQLYLLELKRATVQHHERESALAFMGYRPSSNRLGTYKSLRKALTKDARSFWDKRETQIKKGIINDGRIERNLQKFAKWYRPLIHSSKTARELLRPKPLAEQQQFYRETWNNLRWRALFKIAFSNFSLRFLAPDPDFFNYVEVDTSAYLVEKVGRHFSSLACQNNHILHYGMFGEFGETLPHFVQEEHYEVIQSRLDRLTLHHGFAQDPIKKGRRFNGFNLSNIFEYTTREEFTTLAHELMEGAAPEVRFVYWNILVPRQLSAVEGIGLTNLLDTSVDQDVPDKGWIYYRCLVEGNTL